jgi:hypothetical protein
MKTVISWLLRGIAYLAYALSALVFVSVDLAVSPLIIAGYVTNEVFRGPFALLDTINNRDDFVYFHEREGFLLVRLWRWASSEK